MMNELVSALQAWHIQVRERVSPVDIWQHARAALFTLWKEFIFLCLDLAFLFAAAVAAALLFLRPMLF